MSHVKIMKKAANELEKDAKKYDEKSKHDKGKKKKHEIIEEREAKSAAKAMKKRAKSAHEY